MRGQKTMVDWDGQQVPLMQLYHDLSEQGLCNVSYAIVCKRFASGWTAKDALTMPPQPRGRKKAVTCE